MKDVEFVHLHNHTEYSLLDGASRIPQLAQQAADYHFPALAITDHGNLFGAIEFYRTARERGVKPIIGCEVYIAPGSHRDRVVHAEIPESSFHLTLLCENLEGYRNLSRLVSLAYLDGFYYRPRIDKELLARYHKGLIAQSACLKGEVNYYLNQGAYDKARAAAAGLSEIMGKGNFNLEVMRLGLPEGPKVEAGAERIGQELGLPLVATNDCHYLKRSDREAHDALLCLQTGKRVKDRARLRFGTDEVYLKSPDEMAQLFSDKPQWLANTLEVAERCNLPLEAEGQNFSLPVFPRPEGFDSDFAYLTELANKGIAARYPTVTDQARQRLNYELSVIGKMGFAGYFLIVKDIVDYAHAQAIPVGPGRGSAVGSLVLYVLGITDLDPLRFGLIFERFLTTERVTLPDIDVDFADNRRADIIAYIRRRYGEDCVAQIITFGTMGSKAAVRDVGRVLDVPLAEVDRLAKLIPQDATLTAALAKNRELKELVNSQPAFKKVWEIALRLEGIARHASIHASGVVITPRPLIEQVPLYKSSDADICTQYDMNALEAIGLLKMDVLGLRTLSVIDTAQSLLAREGVEFNKDTVPLDDRKTYDLLQRADVVGVFQLESPGMQNLLVRTTPENLEDIMAVISLHRPGPMGNVDIEDYVRRKSGKTTAKLMHPAMDQVLADTHGVIIYQEQVMKLANLVAGFSLSEADKLRRVMAKKIPELMAPMREEFLAGAKRQHVSEKVAKAIFDLIEPFAGYGFNKSHAAGYAMLSYLTAYLKANYPIEFLTAVLTSEIGNADKLRKFVLEVRRMGLTLLGPDVNSSDYPFTIEQVPATEAGSGAQERRSAGAQACALGPLRACALSSRAIRFGLGGIKNLGQGVCQAIVKNRSEHPYTDFTDFVRRTREAMNRKAYEALIMAGALDCFNPGRQELLDLLPRELEKASSLRAAMLDRQVGLFGNDEPAASSTSANVKHKLAPGAGAGTQVANGTTEGQEPGITKPAVREQHSLEKLAFGFYLSSHPLEEFQLEMETLRCTPLDSIAGSDAAQPMSRGPGWSQDAAQAQSLAVAGIITGRRFKQDKNGRDYAILQLEDITGRSEVMVFSNTLENSRRLVKTDEAVIVVGKLRTRGEGQTSIWADALYSLSEARAFLRTLTVSFRTPAIDDAALLQLRRILEQHPGPAQVFFQVPEDETAGQQSAANNHEPTTGKHVPYKRVRVKDLTVLPSTPLIREVQALPLVRSVQFNGNLPPFR